MYRVILRESTNEQSKYNFKNNKLIDELAFDTIQDLNKQLANRFQPSPLFQVLGSTTESTLNQGDVLRIGNVRLVILQTSNDLHEQKLVDLNFSGWQKLLDSPGLDQEKDQQQQHNPSANLTLQQNCFICRDINPQFILSCNCKGSMSRVHRNCYIQHLTQTKQYKRRANWFTYKPQFFKCKICQQFTKKRFKFRILSQFFQRILSTSEGPFMLMYALNRHHQEIGFGLIKGQGIFYVGRHYKLSNIYLKDISVSRNACVFAFNQKKQWVVKQSKNRFGVLRPLKQIQDEGTYVWGDKLIQIQRL